MKLIASNQMTLTNLLEKAETRRETFYKLTNSADVPEVPSGSRNLAFGTSADWNNGINSFSGIKNETVVIYKIYNKGLKVGDKINARIVIKYSDIVAVEGQTARMVLQTEGNVTHWDSGGLNVGGAIFPSGEDDEVVLTSVSTITENHLKNEYWNWRLRIDYVSSGRIQWKEAKVEVSDLPTPYSQAPEDLGWSTATLVPTQQQRYLWKFEYVYYSDGSVEVTQPTNISIAGTNGQTSHVHFAFADNATGGGFSLTTPKAYMGWYADFNETASNDPTKYKWGKWKGDQGAPGGKGDDGKTSYLHLAFASSADGKTGFSFTESGQQYQGYYTDFTQTSSTDPTKYTWIDRRAGIEVGTRNLWIQSKATGGFVEEELADNHITGQKKCYRINSGKEMRFIIEPNFSSRLYHQKLTFSAWIKYDNVVRGTNNWNKFNVFKHNFTYRNSETEVSSVDYLTPANYTGTSDWKYVHFTREYTDSNYDQLKGSLVFNLEGTKSGTAWVAGIMVQFGNVATGHVWAPEDVQADIDSKADQALTQQQLEALEAKRQQMIVEIEAKATIEQISELQGYLNKVKQDDEEGRQKIAATATAIEERVRNIEPILTYSQKMQFIDTYITQGNGGMIIGANDSTTKVVVTPDRISFQDGGSEVAYISQSVLHIDNGVFTLSLQLGHFITRAHPKNQYVNATYFVK